MIDAIKANPLYKRRTDRDMRARQIIEENQEKLSSKTKILPGQLVLFKYLNPKTADELEYYDASPCTIFFNVVNTSQGKRVLGFNVHYFPPAIRYRIIDKIFTIFRPVYRKYFDTGVPSAMDAFDYEYLINELSKQKLDFAVRMYIPALIGDTRVIAPKDWPTAMFTEGWFKKETRQRIMQLFRESTGLAPKTGGKRNRQGSSDARAGR